MTNDFVNEIQALQTENAHLKQELKRTSEALQANEIRHQLISQSIGSVVVDWNLVTNEYQRVNSPVSVLGYEIDEAEASLQWTRSIIHPDDLPAFDSNLKNWLMGSNEQFPLKLRCRHKDGSYRHLSGQAVMLRDSVTGTPLRVVGSYRDSTAEQLTLLALQLSEERYRLAMDALQGIIFDWAVSTNVVYRSSGVQRVFGYSVEESENRLSWWQERVHPDDRPTAMSTLNAALASSVTHGDFYYRFLHRDGHYLNIHSTFLIVRDSQGNAERMVGCMVDVSPRKKAEAARQAAERNFQQLFQDIPLGLIVIDPQLRIVECNQALADMLQYTIRELVGMDVRQLVAMNEWTEQNRPEHSNATHGFEYSWQKQLIRKDGLSIPVHLRGKFIRYQDYQEPCRFGIIENLSERHHTEEEKKKLERHLQETQKLESLGVLAGGIAHDFNNLLTVILGNLSLLKQDAVPKGPHLQALTQAEDASTQAAELCRQMLAYAGRGKLENKPFNLTELVETSKALLNSAASRHHHLHFHLSKGLPSIAGDPSQIRQVLLNLVHNAAEAFTKPGGTIDVLTGVSPLRESDLHQCLFRQDHSTGDYVWLEVRDTGCGMDEATSKRIFEPFFTTKFTGRGLGLAAVAGIVRNHRSLLFYHSQSGEGTWFRIYFPPDPSSARSLTPAAATIVSPKLDKHQGTVLVVDDEPSVRVVLARLLAKRGFAVIEAENGNEALEMAERYAGTLRLIILDLTMPQRDGMSTLQELRHRKHRTPVVVISGYYSTELIPRLETLQAQFLSKPFTAQGLLEVIEPVLAGSAPS